MKSNKYDFMEKGKYLVVVLFERPNTYHDWKVRWSDNEDCFHRPIVSERFVVALRHDI